MREALRTGLLMAFLVALLGIGGWMWGGRNGFLLFAGLGLILNFGSYWFSDKLALMAHRARPLERTEAPAVYAIVERLTAHAGMPMPPIYLIPSQSPNAFATGRSPGHAAVAVTAGLLELLDERELEGVLAHELSHVRNRDVLVATVAAGIAGIISSVGHIMQWGLLLGGSSRDNERGSGLAALAWIIVAPIIALLLQLAISRAREYGADGSGARLSGDPDALADALEKIQAWSERRPYEYAGPATAHLFIVNPLRGARSMLLSMLSTHPPTEKRVARLRSMRA